MMRTPAGAVTSVTSNRSIAEIEDDQAASAAAAAKQRTAEIKRRREAALLVHFPNVVAHNKWRDRALEPVRGDTRRLDKRIAGLVVERKMLMQKAEFFLTTPMPDSLRRRIDANDAAMKAALQILDQRREEMARINAAYDIELAQLRQLWADDETRLSTRSKP